VFEQIKPAPYDPILSLMEVYKADPRTDKIDLGVGVYKTEEGTTPVMHAVKKAEAIRLSEEDTKTYVGLAGMPEFNSSILELLLGSDHPVIADDRARATSTPGGSGALRILSDFVVNNLGRRKVWLSNPSWANHASLVGGVGHEIDYYPYYDQASSTLTFDAMMSTLETASTGDIVLLHGCCHNPCGADLSLDQWQLVTDLVIRKGLLPFVDIAYQGLGTDLDSDAAGMRLMASQVPEMLIAASCSKNFGLYRERIGAAVLIAQNSSDVTTAYTQILGSVRSNYSMPPHHGAFVVATIMEDAELYNEWRTELEAMTMRVNGLRTGLVDELNRLGAGGRFDFIASQKGMFSFCGLTVDQIHRLRDDYGIYMVDSSRVNMAGVSNNNLGYLANSIISVI